MEAGIKQILSHLQALIKLLPYKQDGGMLPVDREICILERTCSLKQLACSRSDQLQLDPKEPSTSTEATVLTICIAKMF